MYISLGSWWFPILLLLCWWPCWFPCSTPRIARLLQSLSGWQSLFHQLDGISGASEIPLGCPCCLTPAPHHRHHVDVSTWCWHGRWGGIKGRVSCSLISISRAGVNIWGRSLTCSPCGLLFPGHNVVSFHYQKGRLAEIILWHSYYDLYYYTLIDVSRFNRTFVLC